MPLEPVDHLDDLVITNPTDTDPVSEGDNHIRNLKIALAAGVTGNADETRLLVQGIARALAVATGFDIRTTVDQSLEVRLLNSDTTDVGISLEMEATTGNAAIRETDGAGVPGAAFMTMERGGGLVSTGQHKVTAAAPAAIDDLTRKDYVDGLIAVLQADIDNIKNGFAFTGAISAPSVTEV